MRLVLIWSIFLFFLVGPSSEEVIQDVTLRHLSPASEARCLDGSLPVYYYRKGYGDGAQKWLVYFEGGGWCYDLEQCHMRTKSTMGTSKWNSLRRGGKDSRLYTSGSSKVNPLMYDWNFVHVRYCDGGSLAGDNIQEFKGQKLYFKGKHNRDETLKSLFSMEDEGVTVMRDARGSYANATRNGYNMSTATEVVIAGCSAGGLGVFLGLDQMADLVRSTAAVHGNTHVTVRGLVDSGFFMDHTSDFLSQITHKPSYGQDDPVTAKSVALNGNKTYMDYGACMRDVFEFMNISAGANPACLRAHSGGSPVRGFPAESNCIFAANLLPHIKTPMFLMQSQFDSWQIARVFGPKFNTAGVNEFGHAFAMAVEKSFFHANNPGHGAFIDSCAHHGMNCESPWSGNHIHYSATDMADAADGAGQANSSAGWSYSTAFSLWYRRSLLADAPVLKQAIPGVNWFFPDQPFPCHECCKCSVGHE